MLWFTAGWLAVAILLHWGLPEPPQLEPALRLKLQHFRAHRDEYDTLFLGSSYVYRGIVPAVFDEQMARAGDPTRSFNFGIVGMHQHESNALLTEILVMRPRKLRYVFIEAGRWETDIAATNRFNRRVVAWHTWTETRSLFRTIWLRSDGPRAALPELTEHGLHMLARYSHIGEGPILLKQWVRGPRDILEELDLRPMISNRGYSGHTLAAKEEHQLLRHEKLLATQDEGYQRSIDRLIRKNAEMAKQPISLARYNVAAVDRQVQAVRSFGAEVFYFVPTHLQAIPELRQLHEKGRLPTLLAYNDPEKYPELYAVAMRFDWSHPIHEGAVAFSELLARDFAASRSAK